MYTIDPTGLIGEYLFEAPTGTTVRNTASPGTLDGRIVASPRFPLSVTSDLPPGFPGAGALNFDVQRSLAMADELPTAPLAQYVQVDAFPDLAELTAEVWVKLDYLKAPPFEDPPPGTYPDFFQGPGACPLPLCKANAWYLFLGTVRTDRNLVFTAVPDDATQGLPQSATPGGNDGGGIVSEDRVHGGQWTHIAATFEDIGGGLFRMQTYVNTIASHRETITVSPTTWYLPEVTNRPLAGDGGTPFRIGQFREIRGNLDYQYTGILCGVRIYERALSRDEIIGDFRSDMGIVDLPPEPKSPAKEAKDAKDGPDKLLEKLPKIEKSEKPEKEKIEKPELPEKLLDPKPPKEIYEAAFGRGVDPRGLALKQVNERLRRLERDVSKLTHFIRRELRPNLAKAALKNEPGGDGGDKSGSD